MMMEMPDGFPSPLDVRTSTELLNHDELPSA